MTLVEPPERPAYEAALRDAGVGFGIVYPCATSEQPGATPHLAGTVGGDNARLVSRSVLNLPLFAYITDEEIDSVVDVMARAGAVVKV